MGYSDIKSRKQHEEDAARIRELERQLKREREDRRVDAEAAATNARAAAEGGGEALKYQGYAAIMMSVAGILLAFVAPLVGVALLVCGLLWFALVRIFAGVK